MFFTFFIVVNTCNNDKSLIASFVDSASSKIVTPFIFTVKKAFAYLLLLSALRPLNNNLQ